MEFPVDVICQPKIMHLIVNLKDISLFDLFLRFTSQQFISAKGQSFLHSSKGIKLTQLKGSQPCLKDYFRYKLSSATIEYHAEKTDKKKFPHMIKYSVMK